VVFDRRVTQQVASPEQEISCQHNTRRQQHDDRNGSKDGPELVIALQQTGDQNADSTGQIVAGVDQPNRGGSEFWTELVA
jgi:hypothetical protein